MSGELRPPDANNYRAIKTFLNKFTKQDIVMNLAASQGDEFFFKPLDLDEEKVKRAPASKAA